MNLFAVVALLYIFIGFVSWFILMSIWTFSREIDIFWGAAFWPVTVVASAYQSLKRLKKIWLNQ